MTPPTREARRARGAVAALFLANGAVFANVVPRYPDITSRLDLSNTAFGSAVAVYGAGALVLGLLGGVLVSRFGSARVAWLSMVGVSLNLVLVGAAPSWWALAAALGVAGSLDAIGDVGGNAHGLRVERLYGRSILNSLHGLWSVGAVVGGAMGAAAAGLGIPVLLHLSGAAVLFVGVAVVASRFLLPGPDRTDPTHADPTRADPTRSAAPRRPRRLRVAGTLTVLGVIAAMAQVMEDVTATWGALYLRGDLGAAAAVSGLGFIALQTLQTVGRLVGDRVVARRGDRTVARAGAALAAVAMAVALLFPAAGTTIVAFGLVGLGIGTLIPAAMRTADGVPGLAPGVGLTTVGTVLRSALLLSPLAVGVVADVAGLRLALVAIPLAAVVVLLLARALPAPPVRARASG